MPNLVSSVALALALAVDRGPSCLVNLSPIVPPPPSANAEAEARDEARARFLPVAMTCPRSATGVHEMIFRNAKGQAFRGRIQYQLGHPAKVTFEVAFRKEAYVLAREITPGSVHIGDNFLFVSKLMTAMRPSLIDVCGNTPSVRRAYDRELDINAFNLDLADSPRFKFGLGK